MSRHRRRCSFTRGSFFALPVVSSRRHKCVRTRKNSTGLQARKQAHNLREAQPTLLFRRSVQVSRFGGKFKILGQPGGCPKRISLPGRCHLPCKLVNVPSRRYLLVPSRKGHFFGTAPRSQLKEGLRLLSLVPYISAIIYH